MDIEKLLNSEQWFNYSNFYDFVSEQNFDVLVEVGVWKGHSVSYLASKNPNKKVYAVDLFDKTYRYAKAGKDLRNQVPYLYDIYNENLKRSNTRDLIEDIQGYSWECADKFEDSSVDFVFIDADHSYDSVVKDINAWYPKVRSGGIFSGHDYLPYDQHDHPGVKKAVDEFCERNKIKVNIQDTVWWFYKA